MLIRAGANIEERNKGGYTPLAEAIHEDHPDFAEMLLDFGAKISNVHEKIRAPNWMNGIVKKRQNVKRGILTFIGVLRKRISISCATTRHIGNRLPRDVVNLLSKCVWKMRFDPRWLWTVPETKNISE